MLLYYYKDSIHQDSVVSVPAMLNMFEELGSGIKVKKAVPNAGNHVMGSYIKSGDLPTVMFSIKDFMRDQLRMTVVNDSAINRLSK